MTIIPFINSSSLRFAKQTQQSMHVQSDQNGCNASRLCLQLGLQLLTAPSDVISFGFSSTKDFLVFQQSQGEYNATDPFFKMAPATDWKYTGSSTLSDIGKNFATTKMVILKNYYIFIT